MSKCCMFHHDDLWWNLDETTAWNEAKLFLELKQKLNLTLGLLLSSEWELFSLNTELFCIPQKKKKDTVAESKVRSLADLNGLLNYSGDIGVRRIYL